MNAHSAGWFVWQLLKWGMLIVVVIVLGVLFGIIRPAAAQTMTDWDGRATTRAEVVQQQHLDSMAILMDGVLCQTMTEDSAPLHDAQVEVVASMMHLGTSGPVAARAVMILTDGLQQQSAHMLAQLHAQSGDGVTDADLEQAVCHDDPAHQRDDMRRNLELLSNGG